MNRMPAIAIALVSSAVFATFVLEQPASHRVFAAAQAQAPQAQAQQGQSSKPTNGLVITLNGKPLTPDELLQLQASGLELEVKALQTQLKTDEDSIHALQTSLQTLQTQFANHSHKVTTYVPGHFCTGLNQYIVTQAGSNKQVTVGLETVQACANPKWTEGVPSSWESLDVSTPVQGAQTPQQ